MKLHIVPAKQGLVWVQQGIRTFWRQPLAFTGLFFLFMAWVSVLSMIPVIGAAVALLMLPAATLGLMVATEQAASGKFPMPTVLMVAFRAGQQRLKAMLLLGLLYAASFLGVMLISAMIDGGGFAKVYLANAPITPEVVNADDFQTAMWVATFLYIPLSMIGMAFRLSRACSSAWWLAGAIWVRLRFTWWRGWWSSCWVPRSF
ncbi:MAG: hypothetical protein RIS60_2198 [Pseudomonadota bacterium]